MVVEGGIGRDNKWNLSVFHSLHVSKVSRSESELQVVSGTVVGRHDTQLEWVLDQGVCLKLELPVAKRVVFRLWAQPGRHPRSMSLHLRPFFSLSVCE